MTYEVVLTCEMSSSKNTLNKHLKICRLDKMRAFNVMINVMILLCVSLVILCRELGQTTFLEGVLDHPNAQTKLRSRKAPREAISRVRLVINPTPSPLLSRVARKMLSPRDDVSFGRVNVDLISTGYPFT